MREKGEQESKRGKREELIRIWRRRTENGKERVAEEIRM